MELEDSRENDPLKITCKNEDREYLWADTIKEKHS
jgi:hypothetical protein